MSLFIPDALNDFVPKIFDDEQELRNFIRMLNNQANTELMNTLRFIEFVSPNELSDYYALEQNQQNIDRYKVVIGAQELESVVARVELNNQIYLFCFDIALYEGRWYIHSLGGNIGALLDIPIHNSGVILESDLELD